MRPVWKLRMRVLMAVCVASTVLIGYWFHGHDLPNNDNHQKKPDFLQRHLGHDHEITDYGQEENIRDSHKPHKNSQEHYNNSQEHYENSREYYKTSSDNRNSPEDHENVLTGQDRIQRGNESIQEGSDHIQLDTDEAQHVQNETDEAQHFQEEARERWGRPPRVILLLTTWRSGSTFLGELLATAAPDTFYSYEPLHRWKINVLRANDSSTQGALAFLKGLFLCHLQEHAGQVAYLVRQPWYLRWNTRLSSRCHQGNGTACSDAAFVSQVCRNSSLHVAKVVRLGLRWVLPLLQDDELDLQVVYLVRDPRAVLRSRAGLSWCRSSPSCRDPRQVCSSLHQDLLLLPYFLQHYPHRFKMVLYERLLEDFDASIRQLFGFLQLPLSVRHLLKAPGRRSSPRGSSEESGHARGTYGTFRSLKYQARVWRFRTPFRDMLADQRHCLSALRLLGLKVFTSAVQYNNHHIHILQARPMHIM